MGISTNPTGYGHERGLVFDGNKSKYKLCEVKFLAFYVDPKTLRYLCA